MMSPETTTASRPSLWAPYSLLFHETPDTTAVAGAVEAVAGTGTPPETSPASPTPVAPGTSDGTSETPTDVVTSFRLEDVPEAYREHVERYVKVANGDYTRKTMELAEQRKQLAPMLTLQQALDSDDEAVRDTALTELLAKYGWDVDPGDTPEEALAEAQAAGAVPETAGPTTPDPALAARLDQLEARHAAREAQDEAAQQAEYQERFRGKLFGTLDTWAKTQDVTDHTKLPEHTRDTILALVRGLGPDENGMPQIEQAISLHEANVAAAGQKYLASKDVPELDLNGSGTASEKQFDPRDDKQRLAKAQAIAGRHL